MKTPIDVLPATTGPGAKRCIAMTHETELPCSDCGSELEERTVEVGDLTPTADLNGTVTVATCPTCGARYYPRETLSRLANVDRDTPSLGDS